MIWNEFIRSLGHEGRFIMIIVSALFIGVLLGLREFRWDEP